MEEQFHYLRFLGLVWFCNVKYKNYKIDLYIISNYKLFNSNARGNGWLAYKKYAVFVIGVPYKVMGAVLLNLAIKYNI